MSRTRGAVIGVTDAQLRAGHRFMGLLESDHPAVQRAIENVLQDLPRADALGFAEAVQRAWECREVELLKQVPSPLSLKSEGRAR